MLHHFTDEEAEEFGHAGKQHRGSNRSQHSADVLCYRFTVLPGIPLVILHQDEDVVDPDSQYQEGNHLNDTNYNDTRALITTKL